MGRVQIIHNDITIFLFKFHSEFLFFVSQLNHLSLFHLLARSKQLFWENGNIQFLLTGLI